MAPRAQNNTSIAYPLYGADGLASGWFKFQDQYLGPEVLYGSWPPVTTIRLGGRTIHSDRPVPVKVKLLEPHEDHHFWCSRKQHSERVNLGEYHRDFGDVEVCYSFSSPQTHIYCCGYSIHFEAFENLTFNSYNATVRVRPEHLLGDGFNSAAADHGMALGRRGTSPSAKILMGGNEMKEPQALEGGEQDPSSTKSALVSSFLNQSSPVQSHGGKPYPGKQYPVQTRTTEYPNAWPRGYFPLYTCEVPIRREGLGRDTMIDYIYTPQHFNDCERNIHFRDQFDVGVGISTKSSPVSVPPVYPPLIPYEYSEFVFSMGDSRTRGGRHVNEILKLKRKGRSSSVRKKQPLQIEEVKEWEENPSNDSVACCPDFCPDTADGEDLDDQSTDQSYGEDASVVFVHPPRQSKDSGSRLSSRPRYSGGTAGQTLKSRQPIHRKRQNQQSAHLSEWVPPRPVAEWKGGQVVDPRRPNNLPSWVSPDQVQAVQKLVKRTCDTAQESLPMQTPPAPLVYSPARLFGDPGNVEQATVPFWVVSPSVPRQKPFAQARSSSPSFGLTPDVMPRSPTVRVANAVLPQGLAGPSWITPTLTPAGGRTAKFGWHDF